MWNFTVWVEMPRLLPMARLPSPSAIMPRISSSRGVSGSVRDSAGVRRDRRVDGDGGRRRVQDDETRRQRFDAGGDLVSGGVPGQDRAHAGTQQPGEGRRRDAAAQQHDGRPAGGPRTARAGRPRRAASPDRSATRRRRPPTLPDRPSGRQPGTAARPAAIPIGRRPALPAAPASSGSTRAPRRRSPWGAPHREGLDHSARHGQGQPARDHRVDADHPSAGIGHGPAGVAGGEAEIGLNPPGPRVVARCRRRVHDPRDHGPDQSERMADRQHQLARAKTIRVAHPRRRKIPASTRSRARSSSRSQATSAAGKRRPSARTTCAPARADSASATT